jgi:hypothetical protein
VQGVGGREDGRWVVGGRGSQGGGKTRSSKVDGGKDGRGVQRWRTVRRAGVA